MEEKINVAEILKDKPQGTKLYDLLYNIDVELDTISTTDTETVVWCTNETDNNTTCHRGYSEFSTVRGCPDGLQILLPSKEMRDWNKFAWKKGDILVYKEGNVHIIFEGFDDDTYKTFHGKHYLWKYEDSTERYEENDGYMQTSLFEKANDDVAQTYIKTIEEKLGGKLNGGTLEIEKTQPEFKDGDILYAEKDEQHVPVIFILNITKKGRFYYACLTLGDYIICDYTGLGHIGNTKFRLATEAEKQQLFSALAKEGKAWDAERKQVVDLKPKWTPKPFDRVITRNAADDVWTANIFSHMDSHGEYVTIACVGGYTYCLPYNEKTAKLIGTTNNVEG